MSEVVVGKEWLKILHIECRLSFVAYFFFFESNAESTSNVNDLYNGSIPNFDDEPKLILMFRYEKWFPNFWRHPTNIMVANTENQETLTQLHTCVKRGVKCNMSYSSFGNIWKIISSVSEPHHAFPVIQTCVKRGAKCNMSYYRFGNIWKLISSVSKPHHAFPINNDEWSYTIGDKHI